jgi:seryl-tRNA synthetase
MSGLRIPKIFKQLKKEQEMKDVSELNKSELLSEIEYMSRLMEEYAEYADTQRKLIRSSESIGRTAPSGWTLELLAARYALNEAVRRKEDAEKELESRYDKYSLTYEDIVEEGVYETKDAPTQTVFVHKCANRFLFTETRCEYPSMFFPLSYLKGKKIRKVGEL